MLKSILEWFLSLFAKENGKPSVSVVEEEEEQQPDNHTIIIIDEPVTESGENDSSTYIINEEDIIMATETLELEVVRTYVSDSYSIGKLYIDGVYFCDTIEDKDRGLTDEMSVDEIKKLKVFGETAIPRGRYEITMTYSPKFSKKAWGTKYKGNVPQIMDVKCYDGVRIHPANKATELEGCIAPGKNLEKGKVLQSTDYYYKLLDNYILPALEGGRKVFITVTLC